MTPAREVAVKLLREFPTAATLTLAKKAYKEFPELWTSLEGCRDTFRTLRGAHGSKGREKCSTKEFFREPQKPGDPFDKLPEPRHIEQWGALEISGPANVLVLSDVHIPYHAPAELKLALGYGKSNAADLIVLNGDIADFFSISRWENDPRQRDFAAEIRDVKVFLTVVRESFKSARIIYKAGNHEERFIRYMRLKAPELIGVDDFDIRSILGLGNLGIEWVDGLRPVKVGALNILHGHEHVFAISNPVNPARGLFLRAKCHAVCGHFHQHSQHSDRNLEQKVISTWSTGCLCDLHPEYRPLNAWSHGFLFAQIDATGAFQVDNLRVIDGKVWH